MLKPALPPYDVFDWQKKPFFERLRMVCQAWAIQGYGTPPLIYLVYIAKVFFYIWAWSFFCSFSPGMGGLGTISTWWLTPIAFQKAILWSMAFEGLGFGCGSGPLTGRYMPPLGGMLYFLRPGTTKMPLFPGIPVFGGIRRTFLDVALYIGLYVLLFRALCAPQLSLSLLWPILVVVPILGLTDKTIFLSLRSEHYLTALVCLCFAGDWLAAEKWVWVAVWFWAATSKLNAHFPSVVCVMISNSPMTAPFGFLRRAMYRDYPNDLRPSGLAMLMAHMGTVIEYSFPLVLLLSSGGWPTTIALCVMLAFHFFITSNIPMGVPIEWNFMMVYGAIFLFGQNSHVAAWSLHSPVLIGFLVVMLVLVQLWGNFFPHYVSFLCSMRYYAGNWAYSVWLFRGKCMEKFDTHLTKTSPLVPGQLGLLYDEQTIIALLSKVQAFRAMHIQGRALQLLVPKAVGGLEEVDAYEYMDGEIVAGLVVGWNFGEGHLHNMQLLRAVQEQCQFQEGELRCVFVESQPMGNPTLSWTIADAATGVRETGNLDVRELVKMQPWGFVP